MIPVCRTSHTCKQNKTLQEYRLLGVQYIPRNMHTVFALLCFVVVIHWLIFPYPSGLLHWHCGNLTIAPVPAKQPWWIWINTSCEFIMNDCITTTKQSTTKPCAYFLGYTVRLRLPQSVKMDLPQSCTKPSIWFNAYSFDGIKHLNTLFHARICNCRRFRPGRNRVDFTHKPVAQNCCWLFWYEKWVGYCKMGSSKNYWLFPDKRNVNVAGITYVKLNNIKSYFFQHVNQRNRFRPPKHSTP